MQFQMQRRIRFQFSIRIMFQDAINHVPTGLRRHWGDVSTRCLGVSVSKKKDSLKAVFFYHNSLITFVNCSPNPIVYPCEINTISFCVFATINIGRLLF